MDDVWYHILSYLPAYEKIRLGRVCKLWQTILNIQLRLVEVLDTAVYVRNVPPNKIINFILAILDRSSNRLRSFRLRKYKTLTVDEDLVQKLLAKAPYLKTFEITNAFITHKALSLFDQLPREIQEFRLKYCVLDTENPEITRYALKRMLQQCIALRQFMIVGIGSCHGYLVIDDDLLIHLPQNVRFLSTSAGDSLQLDTVEFTNKLVKLEAFDARHSPLSNNSLQQLADNCPNLLHLDVSYSQHLDNFSPISSLKKIRFLHLKQTHLNDHNFALITANCQNLEKLDIGCCETLTENGLLALKNCTKLKWLDVSGISSVTNALLRIVANYCTSIEVISFRGCPKVTLEGFKNVAALKKLRRINGHKTSCTYSANNVL